VKTLAKFLLSSICLRCPLRVSCLSMPKFQGTIPTPTMNCMNYDSIGLKKRRAKKQLKTLRKGVTVGNMPSSDMQWTNFRTNRVGLDTAIKSKVSESSLDSMQAQNSGQQKMRSMS